jgi:hypothetical protein
MKRTGKVIVRTRRWKIHDHDAFFFASFFGASNGVQSREKSCFRESEDKNAYLRKMHRYNKWIVACMHVEMKLQKE